jgi:hypothetical protein
MVTDNHEFVRSIIRTSNRTPTIICYTDEQIMDLKNICASGQAILGVDKTYNLCDMHVTVTCYKQISVCKVTSKDPPIFIGPMFIHDNSDVETYGQFFSHLRLKLIDTPLDKMVIGTDDEKALVNAISTCFPDATHIMHSTFIAKCKTEIDGRRH